MWFKHCKVFLFNYIVIICAKIEGDLIYDYFAQKKVLHVIGFTCDSPDDDFLLLKRLSRMDIKVMLYKLYNGSINRVIQANYYKLGIFIDIRCYNNAVLTVALAEATTNRLYDELRCWLLLGRNLQELIHIIDDRSFGLSTDFVIVPINRQSKELVLYDVYNPWKQGYGQLNITILATWDPLKGLAFHMAERKLMRRSNLHGMSFKAASISSKYKPKNVSLKYYLENSERSTVDGFLKFGYIVLKYMTEMFNMSLHLGEIPWEKNDTVGPILRALSNNEVDISGHPVLMRSSRLSMVKFVYPSWPFRSCFLLRSPQPNVIKFGEIFKPFAWEIWGLVIITLIISGLALFITSTFECEEHSEFMPISMRCSNSFLLTSGAICLQTTDIMLHQTSSRITFLCVLLYSCLMYNYYSACVVSVRLNEPIIKINDSLNELAKTGLKVATEPLLYFDFLVKENAWETKMFYSKRWLTTPEGERFLQPDQGMQLVRDGRLAYHTHPDIGYPYVDRFYTNRQICELTEVNLLKFTYSTIAVTYNSTIAELMKIGFAKLSEHGIRRRELNLLTARKPPCRQDALSATSITINEFMPHLVVLAIGAIISVVICAFENFEFSIKTNRKNSDRWFLIA